MTTEKFIYQYARPLDLKFYEFLKNKASKQDVIDVLTTYQNDDGGFGHAIEPDFWNPHSTPIATWKATEYLRQINYYNANHPMIKKMIDYLINTRNPKGFWAFTDPSNNDFPHAIWWRDKGATKRFSSYNPTASLLGFLRRTGVMGLESDIKKAYLYLMSLNTSDMHELPCWLDFYDDLKSLNMPYIKEIQQKIENLIDNALEKDSTNWSEYTLRPSTLFYDKRFDAFAKKQNTLIKQEKAYLINQRQSNGGWPVPWQWHTNYREWHTAKTWWQGILAIKYSLFMRVFD